MSSGIGAEITSLITEHSFYYLDAPPKRISSADVPLPYSSILESHSIPSKESIVNTCISLLNLKMTN